MSPPCDGQDEPHTQQVHVVGAAILSSKKCLVARRSQQMASPGKWEFPGGKVETGETPKQALAREIREELGLEILVGKHLGRGSSHVGALHVVLDVYIAKTTAGTLRLTEHAEADWFGAETLAGLDWAAADVPVVGSLIEHLGLLPDGLDSS